MNSDNKKINGWINLNKPEGISSSKCVITLKKILNVKKPKANKKAKAKVESKDVE